MKVHVSSKRTHSLIKIRWDAPDSSLITHYEIMGRAKKGKYIEKPITKVVSKCSATFSDLKPNTDYCFKVRACNGSNVIRWSRGVEANTQVHKAIKAAFSPGIWAFATVLAAIIVPITGGGKLQRT